MHERSAPLQENLEATVDRLIRAGHYAAAKELLAANLHEAASTDRDKYHHLAIKNATIPLYEIIQNGITPESENEVRTTLRAVGDLLEDELDHFIYHFDIKLDRDRSKGRLGELTVLHLATRDRARAVDASSPILVPAPRVYDIERDGFGVDFLLTTANGSLYDGYLAQVKSLVTSEHRRRYVPYINLIGLNELDPENYGLKITRPASLVRRLLRERTGTATTEDLEQIEAATTIFYEKMHTQVKDKFAAHPTKTGWIQPIAA